MFTQSLNLTQKTHKTQSQPVDKSLQLPQSVDTSQSIHVEYSCRTNIDQRMDDTAMLDNNYTITNGSSSSSDFSNYLSISCGLVLLAESLLTIITIWRTPALHTNTFRCLASLAMADISLAAIFFLNIYIDFPDLTTMMRTPHEVICLIVGLYYSTELVCIVHMGIVAVDRYIYIAHPFFYTKNMTKRCIRTILALTWTGWVLFTCGPQLIILQDDYLIQCLTFQLPAVYVITCAVIYYSCFVIMFVFYFLIAHVAYKHKKAANARRRGLNSTENITSSYSQHAAYKSVKFFSLMYGTFFIFKFPSGAVVLIHLFVQVPDLVNNIVIVLFVLGSLVHFGLNSVTNKQFRLALRKTFTDNFKCCHKTRQDK